MTTTPAHPGPGLRPPRSGSALPSVLPPAVLAAVRMPAVAVLVGTSGSGKTTLRRRLLAAGLEPARVVSLDDLRRHARADDLARGRAPRELQDYAALAVGRAGRRADALAALGAGYLADATHLRRRDRRAHLRTAQETGLPAVALLTALVSVEELAERNARRPGDEQVPLEVLARQHHRRSLLCPELLLQEGFGVVLQV